MITWSLLTKRKCICQFSDGENVTDVLPFNAGTFGQITRICTHLDISRRPFEHTFPAFLLHSSTLWYTPFNLLAISFDVFEESLSLIPSARQQPPLPPFRKCSGPFQHLMTPLLHSLSHFFHYSMAFPIVPWLQQPLISFQPSAAPS